ncbi:hypothetical protein D3C81_1929440 [compost metagenome]
MMAIGADCIHAQQFARHLETGDLLFAAGIDLASLEMTDAHRIQIGEGIAHAVQVIIARDLAAAANDLVQPVHIILTQAHRQAQLMHAACRAAGAQGADIQGGIGTAGGHLAHISWLYSLLGRTATR